MNETCFISSISLIRYYRPLYELRVRCLSFKTVFQCQFTIMLDFCGKLGLPMTSILSAFILNNFAPNEFLFFNFPEEKGVTVFDVFLIVIWEADVAFSLKVEL